jgi:hypothetical protein
MIGWMDGWMDGFEFKKNQRGRIRRRIPRKGILDFFNVFFCTYLLDLQPSSNPFIQSSIG